MEEFQNINEINSREPVLNIDSPNIKVRKGFVEKYFEHLKWSVTVFHIFFAIWATYIFLQALLPAIYNLIFAIPLIVFIITSTVGSIRLIKGKSNAYNYLLVAQIPQVVVLKLNGFVYFLLIGQWIILRIGGGQLFGFDFGLLNANYSFIFGNAKDVGFLFGINIIPIILIFILLKMEEIEENIKTTA